MEWTQLCGVLAALLFLLHLMSHRDHPHPHHPHRRLGHLHYPEHPFKGATVTPSLWQVRRWEHRGRRCGEGRSGSCGQGVCDASDAAADATIFISHARRPRKRSVSRLTVAFLVSGWQRWADSRSHLHPRLWKQWWKCSLCSCCWVSVARPVVMAHRRRAEVDAVLKVSVNRPFQKEQFAQPLFAR